MKTVLALLLLSAAAPGAGREVAITIDDLPRGGDGGGRSFAEIREMTERLLAPFREQKIPLTGFVTPGRTEISPDHLRRILDLWLDAGAELGNHTWSHADLNRTPAAEYEAGILEADAALRPVVAAHGKKLEFFRYPMLHAGASAETKRAIQQFLAAHHYQNAPVTFDNSDYMFAAAYNKPRLRARVKREYVPYLESVVLRAAIRGGGWAGVSTDHAAARQRTQLAQDARDSGDVPQPRVPLHLVSRRATRRGLPVARELRGAGRILVDPPLVDDQGHAEQG
jgi:peptidoglycan/xylan/chitin deacetylase (PgdA/CDA1 family)